MLKMKATYKIAMAAGQDEGNRHAKKHGRKIWNRKDWEVAAAKTSAILGLK